MFCEVHHVVRGTQANFVTANDETSDGICISGVIQSVVLCSICPTSCLLDFGYSKAKSNVTIL